MIFDVSFRIVVNLKRMIKISQIKAEENLLFRFSYFEPAKSVSEQKHSFPHFVDFHKRERFSFNFFKFCR